MSEPVATFPCSVNSFPFWQSGTLRRNVDAAWNMGQQRYIDSLLPYQTKIPYNCKALFTDTFTFQFKTQMNSPVVFPGFPTAPIIYTHPSTLKICKSMIGSKGYPVPSNVFVDDSPNPLNPTNWNIGGGSNFWGLQNPAFDTFYNPLTGYTQRLVTYMWSFSFGDYLSQVGGDSGIYFLRFDNYDVTGAIVDTWYSEPILLFGTDALLTPQTSRTLLFQGQNSTDKSDIIIDNWYNNPALYPLFNLRCEASVLDYEPKGVFLGFYQENWLQESTLSSSWETFTLQVGSGFGSTAGIPAVFYRIASKYIEFDFLTINNQFYMYDLGAGGTSPTAAWKTKKNRVNGLISGSIPVRYKYPSQLFINPLSETSMIFSAEFSDVFS